MKNGLGEFRLVKPRLLIKKKKGKEYSYWHISIPVNSPDKYIIMSMWHWYRILKTFDKLLEIKSIAEKLLAWFETEVDIKINALKEMLRWEHAKLEKALNDKDRELIEFRIKIITVELQFYYDIKKKLEEYRQLIYW